jgi:hypothetical protein
MQESDLVSSFSARYVLNIGKVLFHVLGYLEAGTAAG